MVADGTLAFCTVGQRLERAIITANALSSILRPSAGKSPATETEDDAEIRYAAFLRLLGSRDLYRRVYQMRIETGPMLDLLMKNPSVPRSVCRCLQKCASLLRAARDTVSPATQRSIGAIDAVADDLRATDWLGLAEEGRAADRCKYFFEKMLSLHHSIADGFLNHQIHIRNEAQPTLFGTDHAI